MNKRIITTFLTLMVFLVSCSIPKEKEEYEILKNENEKLKLENEKLLIKLKNNANEANQIILEIEKNYKEKEYCVVKYYIKKLEHSSLYANFRDAEMRGYEGIIVILTQPESVHPAILNRINKAVSL